MLYITVRGVVRKCISSDSQVSLTQKQVVDDSGKLASVYSKPKSGIHRLPRGSNVIDDTNYHVTAYFKALISEHAALAHLLYTHTFSQGLCHPPLSLSLSLMFAAHVLKKGLLS